MKEYRAAIMGCGRMSRGHAAAYKALNIPIVAGADISQEALDKVRWGWLDDNDGWFSFSAREIEVYAAKLVLLHHWRRILSEKQQRSETGSRQT